MGPKIIFEDTSLLILDKPAGMVVNRAESVRGQTVQDWVEEKAFDTFDTSKLLDTFQKRSGIVHRLDKETSGILVVAKTKEAFENLQAQFKARKVDKAYKALVHGKVEPEKGSINAPVGRLPWNRERFGVLPSGRDAVTFYKVLAYYQLQATSYTLLELKPKTGRTHQIRVHLKHLGHSIVSDDFYAGRKTARADRTWCPRLFLHASQITFNHPKTGRKVSFKSELPKDLLGCLKSRQK